MHKVLLVHISSSGCCNTLVTMLNNGDFGFPYCATPAFSSPAVWCRVFQSRVFSRPSYIYDLISLQPLCSTRSYVVTLARPPSYSSWKSTTALSAMPHRVSGMNFPKNFANLSIMSLCYCYLIFLSPVHHHHHHHHHFHYASLHLCSTPDSKLTFSINPSPP